MLIPGNFMQDNAFMDPDEYKYHECTYCGWRITHTQYTSLRANVECPRCHCSVYGFKVVPVQTTSPTPDPT